MPKIIQPNSDRIRNRTQFSTEQGLKQNEMEVLVKLLAEYLAHSRHFVSDDPVLFLVQLPFQDTPFPFYRRNSSDCFLSAFSLLGRYSYRDHSFESSREERDFINPTLPTAERIH